MATATSRLQPVLISLKMTRWRWINGIVKKPPEPLRNVGQKFREDVKECFTSKTNFSSPANALFPSIFHRGLIPSMLVELQMLATNVNGVTDVFEFDLEVSSFVGINAQLVLDHFELC
jgi:hypothetical protein